MAEVEDKLKDYEIMREGDAEILMLKSNAVFFNPVQVHNRDMSIATLRTFVAKRKEEHEAMMNKRNKYHQKASRDTTPGSNEEGASTGQHDEMAGDHLKELNQATDEAEDLSKETIKLPSWKGTRELKPPVVLEALAASGLRSLRYAREVDGLGNVIALDNDKASVEACKRNIKFNGLATSGKVETHLADARVYMLTNPKEFDVVDLDPYGSPSVFLDSAVQAVADGGLLMCTATDMAVLCGTNGEVCYSKYGSYPIKGSLVQDSAEMPHGFVRKNRAYHTVLHRLVRGGSCLSSLPSCVLLPPSRSGRRTIASKLRSRRRWCGPVVVSVVGKRSSSHSISDRRCTSEARVDVAAVSTRSAIFSDRLSSPIGRTSSPAAVPFSILPRRSSTRSIRSGAGGPVIIPPLPLL